LEEELKAALRRGRYERADMAKRHRHGRRPRQLVTAFGPLRLRYDLYCIEHWSLGSDFLILLRMLDVPFGQHNAY
jgi:lipopolysaccharide/colanic/teichoic acid biosynthesis glycosyltransferase